MDLRLCGDYRKVVGLAEPFYSNRLKPTDTNYPCRLMTNSVEKPRINDNDEPVVPFFLIWTKPSAANCYPHTPH